MLQPWVRAVARVLPELHPFQTEGTEDAVGFDGADERVGLESGAALLGVAATGLVSGGEGHGEMTVTMSVDGRRVRVSRVGRMRRVRGVKRRVKRRNSRCGATSCRDGGLERGRR